MQPGSQKFKGLSITVDLHRMRRGLNRGRKRRRRMAKTKYQNLDIDISQGSKPGMVGHTILYYSGGGG